MGRPHSSTALKHSSGRKLALQDVAGILDFAASGAGKIAAEENFKHHDERVPLASGELLFQRHSSPLSTSERPAPAFDLSPPQAGSRPRPTYAFILPEIVGIL